MKKSMVVGQRVDSKELAAREILRVSQTALDAALQFGLLASIARSITWARASASRLERCAFETARLSEASLKTPFEADAKVMQANANEWWLRMWLLVGTDYAERGRGESMRYLPDLPRVFAGLEDVRRILHAVRLSRSRHAESRHIIDPAPAERANEELARPEAPAAAGAATPGHTWAIPADAARYVRVALTESQDGRFVAHVVDWRDRWQLSCGGVAADGTLVHICHADHVRNNSVYFEGVRASRCQMCFEHAFQNLASESRSAAEIVARGA